MDRLKTTHFAYCLILFCLQLNAQSHAVKFDALTREKIVATTNTKLVLTGEKLLYKLYCLDEKTQLPSPVSKVVYVMLVGPDGKIAANKKTALQQGVAAADLFIPTQLQTGTYRLIAYTTRMLQISRSNFMQLDVAVVNPFEVPRELLATDNVTTDTPTPSNNQLTTERAVYGFRQKVTLKANNINPLKNGKYTLSVRKKDDLSQVAAQKDSQSKIWNPAAKPVDVLPELRGEIVSGHLISTNAQAVSGKFVSLSLPGRDFVLKIVETDSNGQFVFVLDPNQSQSKAIMQVMEPDREHFNLTLYPAQFPDLTMLAPAPALHLNHQLKTAIEARSVANQIENAYHDRKQDSLQMPPRPKSFYHPLEKRYVLDDYTRFPSLAQTITEVVLEMFTRTENGKQSVHLRNNNFDTEMYGQPLILVDGLPIQNTEVLYNFNPENIFAIDLINDPYVLGPKTFSGIANFATKNADYQTTDEGNYFVKLELDRPVMSKNYYTPNYEKGEALNRIPDYRYQLYWNPDLQTLFENQEFSFYTSDVSGTYEIILSGINADGERVLLESNFEVTE